MRRGREPSSVLSLEDAGSWLRLRHSKGWSLMAFGVAFGAAVTVDVVATHWPLGYAALACTLVSFAAAGYVAVRYALHALGTLWASYGSAAFVLAYSVAGYVLAQRLGRGGELYLATLNLCMSLMASRAGIRMGVFALARSRDI